MMVIEVHMTTMLCVRLTIKSKSFFKWFNGWSVFKLTATVIVHQMSTSPKTVDRCACGALSFDQSQMNESLLQHWWKTSFGEGGNAARQWSDWLRLKQDMLPNQGSDTLTSRGQSATCCLCSFTAIIKTTETCIPRGDNDRKAAVLDMGCTSIY